MSVSGIVITLTNESSEVRSSVLERLESTPTIEVGEPAGVRLPAVIDADSSKKGRDQYRWVESLPGVLKVDVVFASCDGESSNAGPFEGEDFTGERQTSTESR